MSRRQRRARENAARLKVAAARVLRRRARRSGGKPVAAAAVAALTMAGFGLSTAAASAAGTVETGPGSIRGGGEGRLVQPVVQQPLVQRAGGRRLERGSLRTSPSSPSNLVDVGGTLFFTADDGIHGTELWRSDGTRTGTARVKDIKPGVGGSDPSSPTDVGGALFFTARDGIHRREP